MSKQDARHNEIGFDYRPETWMDDAACVGYPVDDWFWERSTPPATKQKARAICAECPVATQCLDYALRVEGGLYHRAGLYGGLSPEQRLKLAREAS